MTEMEEQLPQDHLVVAKVVGSELPVRRVVGLGASDDRELTEQVLEQVDVADQHRQVL